MTADRIKYHAPTKPFSIIDAHNRRALAQGNNPAAGFSADYNGHRVDLEWNDYRGEYVGSYVWNGINRIARGSLESVAHRCLDFHARGGRGASLNVRVRAEDAHVLAPFVEAGELVETTEESAAADMVWHTWRHEVAADCAPDSAAPSRRRFIFDIDLLEEADNAHAYRVALQAKYGRTLA